MSATIDFETRSPVDIRTAGGYVYATHPDTDALMLAYKLGDGPTHLWLRGDLPPQPLFDHVAAGGEVEAHNNQFDRLIWNHVMVRRYGWPPLSLEQCRCSAATAAALSLPRSLDRLGDALGLKLQKDKRGKALIQKFCLPRKPKKDEPPGLYWNEPEDHPDDFQAFADYCIRDVESEHEASSRLVPLSDDELDLWRLSDKSNDRGIRIDRRSAQAALRLADKAKVLLDRDMKLATGGYVTACTQVTKLVEWVASQGVDMASAAKADIEDLLERDDLPPQVRRAVEIRQEAAKTSVSKLKSFVARAGDDGRIRGAFLYHAAGTGRWSSTGAQLHNLPRPRKVFEDAKLDKRTLFEAIRTESPEWLKFLYGDELGRPLHLLSDAIRGFIWAAPGHDILDADYSGIEGAVAAWFCGEEWKVQALFDIIADPTQPDLYRRAAAGILGLSVEVITKKHPMRQAVGKTSELSLQYEGGPGALQNMARTYSVKLDPIFEPVWEAASAERRERAEKRYDTVVKQNAPIARQMTRREFLAAECIKIGWRETNPAIAASWSSLRDAVYDAVSEPGRIVQVLRVAYLFRNGFLWCRLPSGRCLAYGAPRVKQQVWVLKTGAEASETMGREEAEKLEREGGCVIEREAKPAVTVLGVDSQSQQLVRYALYGGLLLENVVQAIARDLLANGIRKAEAAGYPVIGHVHDELLCEVPHGFGDVGEFEKLICELPDWAAGLPLTSGGFRSKRFKKD